MTRFEEIMEVVFKWEGGYVDHPSDPGGATNFGITHKVLAKWRGVSAVSKQEVKNMSKDEARDIFRARYFNAIRGDDLPAPIDLIVMDGAVNHGVGTMVRFLEKAAGLSENGKLSAAEATKLGKMKGDKDALATLAIKLAEARKERYVTRPHAAKFIKGWRNRLNDVMTVAMAGLPRSWEFDDGATGSSAMAEEDEAVSTIVRPVIEDEDLQTALAEWGFYNDDIDGLFGKNSLAAADLAFRAQDSIISGNWRTWPAGRKKIAVGQLLCRDLDLMSGRVDGLFGPITEAAFLDFNRLKMGMDRDTWRDELDTLATDWAPHVSKKTQWPKQKDVQSFYGPPCKQKMKRLHLPFEMVIAWDLGVKIDGFSINEKVHDSAARAFDKIFKEYGDDGIRDLGIHRFGGCNNCRKKRNGTSWSMHAWAIAIDFDPANNKLKWDHKQARLARKDAEKFWQIWEDEGWLSLGRARNFDWMHVQAAVL